MAHPGDPGEVQNAYPGLLLMDGTDSGQSYAAIACRGTIFLGIKFTGLTDGARLGVPGKTYLHARLRSARDHKLAAQLDPMKGADNVLDLFEHQLALNEAWPNLPFEKVDGERASLLVGASVQGSLLDDTAVVVARIEKGALFRKLIDYAMEQAGAVNCVVDAATASAWLFDRAKPMLAKLKAALAQAQLVGAVQKQFGTAVQTEVVAPHLQQLNALYQEHTQG